MNTIYMKQLATLANKTNKGTGVQIVRVQSNDMASNYYVSYEGQENYVDQYDLQEYFLEDGDDTDHYENASIDDRAQALSELALALFNKL